MKLITKENFSERPEWQNNQILSSAKADLNKIWLFAILWNTINLPFIWHFPQIIKQGVVVTLIMFCFSVFGIYMIVTFVRRGQKMRQLGNTALVMQPFPGVIGADLGGTILVNTPYASDAKCEVKLQSIYKYKVKRINKQHYSRRIQWYKETEADITAAKDGIKLQFNFSVPKGLRDSEKVSDEYYYWMLNIKLINADDMIERNYEIPVFKG